MDEAMRQAVRVAELLRREGEYTGNRVKVQGWVRTKRDSKAGVSFIEVNDGSCLKNLQVVADQQRADYREVLEKLGTGCSVEIDGVIQPSLGKGQSIELHADHLVLHGWADPATYPLQKKRHSFEFLRQIAHLRPRTNTIGAVTRVRNRLSYAIHQFFQERNFYYIQTPIITTSDCEGAGDVFRVTSLDPTALPQAEPGELYQQDFFGRPTYLTVSGQLQAEIYALSLGKVYTFGPTFRAENSNTSRHLAEFWMVEPEMAFYALQDNVELAQGFIQSLIETLLSECEEDLNLFTQFMDPSLRGNLETIVKSAFEVITYTEAVELLKKSGEPFVYPVAWGNDLQAEHERYLTEKVFRTPVTIIDFPRSIKPFYMRVNDDARTVAAMDVLVPGVGEIIGGSQREERLEVLLQQMELKNVSKDDYRWYIELREYGTAVHSGFGLGFERLVQFVTGLANIREAIPFPRTPGHADF